MSLLKRFWDLARKTFSRRTADTQDVVKAVVGVSGRRTAGATDMVAIPPAPLPVRGGQPDLSVLNADQLELTAGKDLDLFMRGFSVPQETLEKWIASGFLYPEEVRVAEKLIRLMRNPSRGIAGAADKPQ